MPVEILCLLAEGVMGLDQTVVEKRVESGMRRITGMERRENLALGLRAQAHVAVAGSGFMEGRGRGIESGF